MYSFRPRNYQNNRFIGTGFLAPFLLGGITGGLVAPAFYPPRPPYPPVYYVPPYNTSNNYYYYN